VVSLAEQRVVLRRFVPEDRDGFVEMNSDPGVNERSATLVTSNLPFNEWTEAFGSERLTGALLDRLTHHVHILEMNGESYRLKDSKRRRAARSRS
jgi:hypothetical protein